MLTLITYRSLRTVEKVVYADLHGVKCKPAQKDGATGLETFQYRADESAVNSVTKVPAVYDIETDVQTFGTKSTVRVTAAEFVGKLGDYTFGADGIIRREPAATGVAPARV